MEEIRYHEIVHGDENKSAQKQNNKNMKNINKNQKLQEKQQKKAQKQQKGGNVQHKNRYKGAVIGLSIATGILGLSTIGLAIGCGITANQANGYGTQIESIYKKNYYELVDNTNSADMKISKLLASDNATYQAKMLTQVSQEAQDMQNNISALPLTGDNILQSVRFVNQMAGFCQTLEEKIAQGGKLSESDLKTLREMHDSLTQMKTYLNQMSQKMLSGYSIMKASNKMNGDTDQFTLDFEGVKAADADYPTMIYDGPFSDSVVNAKVLGLKGSEVSKEEAYKHVDKMFKNIQSLKYAGETDGKFSTYNFELVNTDGRNMYVQVTKIGGNILTISGHVDSDQKNIDMQRAEKIALDFAKENGINGGKVVWDEELESQAYFNIAPTENGVILYPDLVKVKVDMEKGDVIGYDAISYFTNHTKRNLTAGGVGIDLARERVDSSFAVQQGRLVLAPLEFNREVLCYEFEATRDGATYYIYYNAATGKEENILKVVETDDGSKLM